MLIVITVAIGTLVYSFASTAFGGFGSGFSNLVSNAGQQLSETLVPEQAYFFTNNTISCVPPLPLASCGGVLYVRNTGLNPIAIQEIYMTNITAPGGAGIGTLGPGATGAQCASNNLAPDTVCFANFDILSPPNDVFDQNTILPMPSTGTSFCPSNGNPLVSSDTLAPGCVAAIRFNLPVTSVSVTDVCTALNPQYCITVHPGTVYSFLFVTARGNEFVVYEKA